MRGRFVWLIIILTAAIVFPVIMLDYQEKTAIYHLDNTEVNELLHSLSDDWDNIGGNRNTRINNEYSFPYEVIDLTGNVLVKTEKDMAGDLGRATTERYTIRDITVEGEVVGYLLIKNDFETLRSDAYISYRLRYLMAVLVESAVIALFLTWVYLNVVKPFESLSEFASDVAAGNLDKPLKMDRGNLFGAFTESFDIMRSELNDAKQKEYEAQRSKMELVSQLSHDIKTPVASIKALGELLQAQSGDPKAKEKLGSIVTKADNIDVMVSDLFTKTLTDLNELTVETSEQESIILDEIIRDADHMDKVTGGSVAGCIILCDPLRTNQVINNIINNSYKYADTPIHLESMIEDDFLVVSFEDEGGGVSEDDLPMITKRFRRGENAKGKPGTGLGLAIASELMEKMGGDLEVSNTAKGLKVTIYFKIA